VRVGEAVPGSGDPASADDRAAQGLTASQQVGVIRCRELAAWADLKGRCGRIAEAKALYSDAEDGIDGMLGSDDSYWSTSIVAVMSRHTCNTSNSSQASRYRARPWTYSDCRSG